MLKGYGAMSMVTTAIKCSLSHRFDIMGVLVSLFTVTDQQVAFFVLEYYHGVVALLSECELMFIHLPNIAGGNVYTKTLTVVSSFYPEPIYIYIHM
jgi:hypothetical protein